MKVRYCLESFRYFGKTLLPFLGIMPWASFTSASNCVLRTWELSWSDHLMGLGVTCIVLNVSHCNLVIPKGELTTSHVIVQYQGRRLRTPMSLAQLVLCRYGKMRRRWEATANLVYNLYKNPTSSTVAAFATKAIMSTNLSNTLNNICLTLMLKRLLKVFRLSGVSFLKC